LLTTALSANSQQNQGPISLVQSGDTVIELNGAGFSGGAPNGVLVGPVGTLNVFTPPHTDLIIDFQDFLLVNSYSGPMPELATVTFVCQIDGVECTGGPSEVLKLPFKTDPEESKIGLRASAKWLERDVSQGPHTVNIYIRVNSQGSLAMEVNHEVLIVTPYREIS